MLVRGISSQPGNPDFFLTKLLHKSLTTIKPINQSAHERFTVEPCYKVGQILIGQWMQQQILRHHLGNIMRCALPARLDEWCLKSIGPRISADWGQSLTGCPSVRSVLPQWSEYVTG